jgi:single-stranded-DNA-specific exonuclease
MKLIKSFEEALTPAQIIEYLKSIEDNSITDWSQIPSPWVFKNMKKAIELYQWALTNNFKIKMVHDSDADGLGTYLLSWYFYNAFFYKNVEFIIVDRKEGYGLLPKHIEPNCLIITADNGITAKDACNISKQYQNCKVLITDHHQVDSHFGEPDADCIINPHIANCDFPFKDINGTFVYWYFLKAVQETYAFNFDMWTFLPELTLTTISDVMPLKHINRFIVKQGLQYLKYSNRRWVQTFLNTHKLTEPLAEDLAFKIIPSINVTGRLTKADESAAFLIQDDYIMSNQWFGYLNNLNNVRKKSQENLFKTIEEKYKDWLTFPFILIPGKPEDGFQKGLLGPTAGRLVEKYKKPAIVLCENNGIYSGSGRSLGDVDILSIIKQNQFIIQEKTGGHKAACGVSFKKEELNNLWRHCQSETNKLPKEQFEDTEHILGKLNLRDITLDLYEDIKKFEPYGEGFPRPTFLVRGKTKGVKKLGKDGTHVTFELEDGLGCKIKCLYFFVDTEIKSSENYSFIVTINHDTFNGRDNVCLFIDKVVDFVDFNR